MWTSKYKRNGGGNGDVSMIATGTRMFSSFVDDGGEAFTEQ